MDINRKYILYGVGSIVVIIVWIYLDEAIATLLGALLGGSGAKDLIKAKESKIIADEHLELMQGDIHQAQEKNQLADTIHAGVTKESEEITGPHTPVKPGKTRKTFKIK